MSEAPRDRDGDRARDRDRHPDDDRGQTLDDRGQTLDDRGRDDAEVPPIAGGPRRRTRGPLAAVAALGPSAHALIPGVYAWSITVAPVAWGRGTALFPKVAAVAGLVSLAAGAVLEMRAPRTARAAAIWGLTLSSALVWVDAPPSAPLHFDVVRGMTGILGWSLFALAFAAPTLSRGAEGRARAIAGPQLRPRSPTPRGDGVYVAVGAVAALALQIFGWHAATPERAVLVHTVTLAAGLAILGGTVGVALARHAQRTPAPARDRLARAAPWLVIVALLAGGGLILAVR